MEPNGYDNRYNREKQMKRINGINGDILTTPNTYTAMRRKNKFKLYKRTKIIIVVVAASLLMLVGKGIYNKIDDMRFHEPSQVPAGYVLIYTNTLIEYDDNIHDNAIQFFDEDVYGEMYRDLNHYIRDIARNSNVQNPDYVKPGDKLVIPIAVPEDSEYLARITEVEQAINKITNDEYWVTYTVQSGDTISGIAARASGSSSETISISNSIRSRNGLSDSKIWPNISIEIVNPALGPLKIELRNLQEQLIESVKVNKSSQK